MQLSERDKVLQVEWIKQWNGNHDTGIKHCHLSSPGWAQKSLRKSRWFSQLKDTWWKDRGFVGNQEVVTKTTDLPWKSTQNSFRSLSSGSSDPNRKGEGTHGTKLWHSVELQSCLGGEQEKKSDNPGKELGERKLPIVGTKGSGGTVAGSRATEAKNRKHSLCQEAASWEGNMTLPSLLKLCTFSKCNFW